MFMLMIAARARRFLTRLLQTMMLADAHDEAAEYLFRYLMLQTDDTAARRLLLIRL